MAKKVVRKPRKPKEIIPVLPVRPQVRGPGMQEQPSGMVIIRLTPEASVMKKGQIAATLDEHAKINNIRGLTSGGVVSGSQKSGVLTV